MLGCRPRGHFSLPDDSALGTGLARYRAPGSLRPGTTYPASAGALAPTVTTATGCSGWVSSCWEGGYADAGEADAGSPRLSPELAAIGHALCLAVRRNECELVRASRRAVTRSAEVGKMQP